jgi:hypothetical protein
MNMIKVNTLIIAVLMIAMIVVVAPVLADNADPGNHSSGQSMYTSKVAAPPTDDANAGKGSIYVAIETMGVADLDARHVSIAPYNNSEVINLEVGVNGRGDVRVPAGKYYLVLPKGHGSSTDVNTWKQETADVTVGEGYAAYVTFIGAGSSASGTPVFVPKDATASGTLEGVTIFFWYYADKIELNIYNPNAVPVHVDITATLTGQQPFPPFGPKVKIYTPGYDVPAGDTTKHIDVDELFFHTPTLSVSAITSAI